MGAATSTAASSTPLTSAAATSAALTTASTGPYRRLHSPYRRLRRLPRATSAAATSAATSTAPPPPQQLLGKRGCSGTFLVEDIERRQANVGEFLPTKKSSLLCEGGGGRIAAGRASAAVATFFIPIRADLISLHRMASGEKSNVLMSLPGAPEEIRTPDPRIRSLVFYLGCGRASGKRHRKQDNGAG
jgi:hypothetical protein